ncbi:MAG TPA: MDR family MFS transporter [Stellaceae bacterium]|nr:MDR family MFS transporter [Stellaceae bacterium]
MADQAVVDQARPAVVVPRRGMVLAAALMATFMPAVESTIVATAMPTIVADLDGFSLFSWIFATPLLTFAVTVPLYGRLADVYGRRRIFFIGTGIFLVGTTLCGFARSAVVLILFRAIQGCGSGAIQPIAATILGDIYTPSERARVQGWSSSVFGVAAVVGPALGAFLVVHVHWSVVFWVNLPVGLAAIAMFWVFLPEKVEKRPHRIDYLGGFLLVVGVGALMLALVQAATLERTAILALVALGLAALAALVTHELRTPEPMFPIALWRRRVIGLSNLAGFGASATMVAVTAVLPAYVQGVMGRSPGTAGFVVGAASVSWMFAAIIAGRLMVRTSYRLTAAIGGVALVAGAAVLLTLDAGSSPLRPAAGAFLIGIAMGFCNTTFLVAVQAAVGRGERGIATGSQMFTRMIGQAVGAALLGAMLNWGIERRLPGAGGQVNKLLRPALRSTLPPGQLARLDHAFALAAHEAFFVVLLVALATFALTLAFPRRLSPIRLR